jgi:hypothetical protein
VAEANAKNSEKLFKSFLHNVFKKIDNHNKPIKLSEIIKLEYGKGLKESDRDLNGIYGVYGANGIKSKTNRFLLSDEQRVIEDKLMKSNSDLFKEPSLIREELREPDAMEEPSPIMEEPVQEERQDRLNPFSQAIERRNEERRTRERRLMGELEERNEERQYEDRENQPQTFRSGSL